MTGRKWRDNVEPASRSDVDILNKPGTVLNEIEALFRVAAHQVIDQLFRVTLCQPVFRCRNIDLQQLPCGLVHGRFAKLWRRHFAG